MNAHRRSGRRRSWRVALGTAVVLAAMGVVPLTTSAASAAPRDKCAEGENDSAAKLIPCIRTADLMNHMVNFQKIADANPGPDGHASRNSGEAGYKASVDYVAAAMKKAGYNVTIQTYTFNYFAFVGKPAFSQVSPTAQDYVLNTDFTAGQAAGAASGDLQPAGGIINPPTATPSSASGCTAADFAGFVPGRIALIQRGSLFSGSLVDANGNPLILNIPVLFSSFGFADGLLKQNAAGGGVGPKLSMTVNAVQQANAPDYNVIAESKEGDPNHVVVVDAHLDAIFGAGMLDNASGSAAILDIAQMMRKVEPRNKLRFIWFGGEELGLLGSNFYVNNLTPTELGKIGFDLDADVLATPNYVVGVLDPEGVQLFSRGPGTPMPPSINAPSRVARDFAIKYLASIGKNNELFSADGTDAFVFEQAGIPASGVLTGQDCCKNAQDVALFGGTTGNFEGNVPSTDGGCVDNPFRWCDNLSNNDPAVLTFMSRAFATMVVKMAFDEKVLGGGDKDKLDANEKSQQHETRGRKDG
jgi:Peptidase family M28